MDGRGRITALAAVLAVAGSGAAPAAAQLRTIYATESGEPAGDFDRRGGNPFASALITALEQPEDNLREQLAYDTLTFSDGRQAPETHAIDGATRLAPAEGEQAVALVLVFADYGDEEGLVSLPGAAFDAYRVGRALSDVGYDVRTVIAADAQGFGDALDAFALEAEGADRSLLYTTGHGVEVDGAIYILPPEAERSTNMLDRAIPLADVKQVMKGEGNRLLIYAGCRDNPLGLSSEEF
jgi:hypothetical protein